MLVYARRFFPVAAFFGGFVTDALTIGRRVTEMDFLRFGGYLAGAAVFALWLAWRERCEKTPPPPADTGPRGCDAPHGASCRALWQTRPDE